MAYQWHAEHRDWKDYSALLEYGFGWHEQALPNSFTAAGAGYDWSGSLSKTSSAHQNCKLVVQMRTSKTIDSRLLLLTGRPISSSREFPQWPVVQPLLLVTPSTNIDKISSLNVITFEHVQPPTNFGLISCWISSKQNRDSSPLTLHTLLLRYTQKCTIVCQWLQVAYCALSQEIFLADRRS